MWLKLFYRCSHGLRTGIFEASKLVLINFAPNLPEIQVMVTVLVVLLVSNFVLQVYVSLWILVDVALLKKLVLNYFKTALVLSTS